MGTATATRPNADDHLILLGAIREEARLALAGDGDRRESLESIVRMIDNHLSRPEGAK